MASRRGRVAPAVRVHAVPARSRVTVKRSQAPLSRTGNLAAALRASKAALTAIEGQLAELLATLQDPNGCPDLAAVDWLRRAASSAAESIASLPRR